MWEANGRSFLAFAPGPWLSSPGIQLPQYLELGGVAPPVRVQFVVEPTAPVSVPKQRVVEIGPAPLLVMYAKAEDWVVWDGEGVRRFFPRSGGSAVAFEIGDKGVTVHAGGRRAVFPGDYGASLRSGRLVITFGQARGRPQLARALHGLSVLGAPGAGGECTESAVRATPRAGPGQIAEGDRR